MDKPEFEFTPVEEVETAEEARDIAVAWQHDFSERSSSWADCANAGGYFEQLAQKFPELREEYQENGIL